MNELLEEFMKISNKQEMKNLLLGLLTPKEIEEMIQRIKIIKMLRKNIPHHEIAERLGVGVATVTRGAKEIRLGRFSTV